MTDALKDFVLNGEAREVDSWWAEKGMGLAVIPCPHADNDEVWIDAGGEGDLMGCVPCPRYATCRAMVYVIEDRVEEGGCFDKYCTQLMLQWKFGGRQNDVEPNAHHYVQYALRASNRQRILAAARVMNLEAPSD